MTKRKPFNKKASHPYQIFLDIDGVIADLDAHAIKTNKYKSSGKLDYPSLDVKWWSNIPIFKGAQSFYSTLKKKAPVRFLTAPIPSTDCFRGKANWISKKFCPKRGRFALLDLIICRGTDKNLLARPNHILIDDRLSNIEQWRQSGGIGILHDGDFTKTLKKLDNVMSSTISTPNPKINSNPMTTKARPSPCIFLDKNGVIADIETHGKTTKKFKPNGKLDYPSLDFKWWVDMPVFTGSQEFYDNLKGLAPVRFLTSPVPLADCYGGTAAWLSNKFLPQQGRFALLDLIICRGQDKKLLARDNYILIDDRRENIQDWVDAGGIGILHQGNFDVTYNQLKVVLASMSSHQKNKKSQPPNPS